MNIYLTGIYVEWDKGLRVYITLDPRHMGKVCGLCGNYDNKAENDFRARSGQLEETSIGFANSWRSQPTCPILAIDPVHPCQQNPNRLYWATFSCNIMRSPAFAACHSYVSRRQINVLILLPSHFSSIHILDTISSRYQLITTLNPACMTVVAVNLEAIASVSVQQLLLTFVCATWLVYISHGETNSIAVSICLIILISSIPP